MLPLAESVPKWKRGWWERRSFLCSFQQSRKKPDSFIWGKIINAVLKPCITLTFKYLNNTVTCLVNLQRWTTTLQRGIPKTDRYQTLQGKKFKSHKPTCNNCQWLAHEFVFHLLRRGLTVYRVSSAGSILKHDFFLNRLMLIVVSFCCSRNKLWNQPQKVKRSSSCSSSSPSTVSTLNTFELHTLTCQKSLIITHL